MRAQLDAIIPSLWARKSLTLGRLVRRRMGDTLLEQLVAPVVHGVHSVHPDYLPLDRAAPGLRAALGREGSLAAAVRYLRDAAPPGSAVAGIRGGVHRLVTELAADLGTYGVDVQLGRRVRSVGGLGGTVVLAAPLEPSGGRRVVLATLVVDSAELDAAPRGTGVLVARGAAGIRARALTHSTAKWEWLRERAGGHHVLRLSYDDEPENLAEAAQHDASALLGVSLPAPAAFARVEWTRSLEGAADVGESVAGSGLAGIVAQASARADELLAEHRSG
jgi:oxygen-dependent protoporphyrinogen oxidase